MTEEEIDALLARKSCLEKVDAEADQLLMQKAQIGVAALGPRTR
jgi:hypothetical protein